MIRAALWTAAPLFRGLAWFLRICEGHARRLTPTEFRALGMFHPTVPLGEIWVVENSGAAAFARSFTLMNTIFIPERINIRNRVDILVHEVAHVWQAQAYGPYYLFECAWHLFKSWRKGEDPYDVDVSLGFPAGGPFEHQAKFLQVVYTRAAEKLMAEGE